MNIRFGSGRKERGIFFAVGIIGVVPSGKPNKHVRSSCTFKSVSVKKVV